MAGFRLILCLAISTTFVLQFYRSTAQTFMQKFCYEEYTRNSTFEDNLELLLSSVSNSTSRNNTTFYNSTVGRFPDTVSGIFQCRDDTASEDCNRCARSATRDIKAQCPLRKETHIWYRECWLRYSNKVIISVMLDDPKWMISTGSNVVNSDNFGMTLTAMMSSLLYQAVHNSTNMFATAQASVTSSQTLYGLLQCSMDINRRDCDRCLSKSINQIPLCCDRKENGTILKPSCILWFDVNKFFQSESHSVLDLNGRSFPMDFIDCDVLSFYQYTNIHSRTVHAKNENPSKTLVAVVTSSVIAGVLLVLSTGFYFQRRKKTANKTDGQNREGMGSEEYLHFKLRTIKDATDNFSQENVLGKGGFGIVYKGMLLDGREIAVKRLSANSVQGAEEFKNEVVLLANLRHRNLVKLFGFCLEGIEKLLIYEFVPNASLDHFIFDPIKCTYLNWENRDKIISGIARGLLYLHEDSQNKIIHRDLKAGNILLDAHMDAKISDFGMAKLFDVDQTRASTAKIVGTRGYMAPEYALYGRFSVKSDVFSFGVLVLEIITGKKNNSFQSEQGEYLLSYAWGQWKGGKALQLVEPELGSNFSVDKVIRCVQIGLLCVQEDIALRPTMEMVVHLLNRDSVSLPVPSTPAFSNKSVQLNSYAAPTSVNGISLTEFSGR